MHRTGAHLRARGVGRDSRAFGLAVFVGDDAMVLLALVTAVARLRLPHLLLDGEVVSERPVGGDIDEGRMLKEMKSFLGDQYQTPPMFSAKKIDGVPLYKMARKGKTIEREPRFIRINEFHLTNWSPPCGNFLLSCSKGTYVRTVLHDLGQNLGCGAHLTALRRTKIDQFEIENAKPLQEIENMTHAEFQSQLIPIREAVPSHVL